MAHDSPEFDFDSGELEYSVTNSGLISRASSSTTSLEPRERPLLQRQSRSSLSETRITSNDHVALEFFWQGFEVYVHGGAGDGTVPCFYQSQCGCSAENGATDEFLRIMPVDECRERSIHDEMKVQIVSVTTGRYLRATRVSKFLRWSETRDERTVFLIQILDRSRPLTREVKFTLASCFWPGHSIGFSQTHPLTAGRGTAKAVGFLTIEKKKNQGPLIFPLRFRAIHRAVRYQQANSPSSDVPVPFVTTSDLLFIDDDQHPAVTEIPLAVLLDPALTSEDTMSDLVVREMCPYCSVLFRRRDALLAHIRDYHGDIQHRESVAGSFCTHCGYRVQSGICQRCQSVSSTGLLRA